MASVEIITDSNILVVDGRRLWCFVIVSAHATRNESGCRRGEGREEGLGSIPGIVEESVVLSIIRSNIVLSIVRFHHEASQHSYFGFWLLCFVLCPLPASDFKEVRIPHVLGQSGLSLISETLL